MKSGARLAWVGLVVVALTACGGDASSSDNTFACGSAASAPRCAYNAQYCYVVGSGASTTAECRALPVGCTGNPCDTCLAALPNRTSCIRVSFGSLSAVNLTASR